MSKKIADSVFLAPGAMVMGDVTLKENVNIWYNAVVRGDEGPVYIGADTNVQDQCVIHMDPGVPVTIGRGVTIGHGAIIHGCTIGDNSLIGMGAVILTGAVIGRDCIIAAGAVVGGKMVVPDGCMVMGIPAKIRRGLTPEEIEGNRISAEDYVKSAQMHKNGDFPLIRG